jgi:hypothetical protein
MPSYILSKLSATVREIRLSRERVGTVTQYGSNYTAILAPRGARKRLEATAPTASAAFHEVIRKANRFDLFGTYDEAEARAALAKRNAETAAAVAELNDALTFVSGRPSPIVMGIRKRRVFI